MYSMGHIFGRPAASRPGWCGGILIVMLVSLFTVAPTSAGVETFVEDFNTTQYMDPLNTTAYWDTVAGEIKLYPFEMSILGNYSSSGTAKDVAISLYHAFIAAGSEGLVIVDLTDPATPVPTGSFNTSGDATAVVLSGDYAYVADGSAGLAVVDISNLGSPVLAGSLDLGSSVTGIAVDGDYAYVAAGLNGLLVLDVSDPSNPMIVGDSSTSGDAVDITVSGNHAFVATANGSLEVFDITDPNGPTAMGSYTPGGTAWGVDVDGNYALLAAGGTGLLVIDIEDTTNPSLLGSVAISGGAYDVAIDGDVAYTAAAGGGFVRVDISNPGFPVIKDSLDTPGSATGVAFGDVYGYVADGSGGLQVLKIRETLPYLVASGSHVTASSGLDIEIAGDHAFVAVGWSGLEVVDISDPANPSMAGTFEMSGIPGMARKLDLEGDFAYLAYEDSGLVVVDVSDPTTPVLAGLFNVFQATEPEFVTALDVIVDGNFAYLITEDNGLLVIDVSDPFAPSMVGQYDPLSLPMFDMALAGDYVYLACGDDGIYVVDISNPAAPAFSTSLIPTNGGQFKSIAVAGDVVFAGGFLLGSFTVVYELDITDPAAPVWNGDGGMIGIDLEIPDIITSGPRVFVATEDESGFNFGVTSYAPGDSLLVLEFPPAGYGTLSPIRGIALAGDFLYLAGDFGLEVVRFFSSVFLEEQNVGQSLIFGYDVAAVKLTTTQTGSINWKCNFSEVLSGIPVVPGEWKSLPANIFPGIDDILAWEAALMVTPGGPPPSCSHLQVDYRYSSAVIDSIVDVPADQGGWARIHFTGSGRDLGEAYDRVSDYIVWRRFDTGEKLLDADSVESDGKLTSDFRVAFPELPLVERSGRFFLSTDQKSLTGFPPGTWEIVGSFPALALEEYLFLTPTLADSSAGNPAPSVHLVTAHGETDFWVSAPDSGYSLDNIAPGVPETVTASYESDRVILDWDDAPETDFQYYRIYRDDHLEFVPSPANLVQVLSVSGWTDLTPNPWEYHYKITGLDHAGNESEVGSPGTLSGVGGGDVPVRTALLGAVPNPFNPSTKLSFELSVPSHARLKIYDTAGRLVATLVDEVREVGSHQVIWDGRDETGRMSSAGVYLYRLEAGNYSETKRMTLIK